jgi:hypothetical protein
MITKTLINVYMKTPENVFKWNKSYQMGLDSTR